DIVISVGLSEAEIGASASRINQKLNSALDVGPAAQKLKERIGGALNAGIEEALRHAAQIKKQVGDLFGGNQIVESAEKAKRAIRDVESETIRLAQARARLQVANGDVGAAEATLRNALANTTRETATTLNAERQLVAIQAQVKNAASASETALLR